MKWFSVFASVWALTSALPVPQQRPQKQGPAVSGSQIVEALNYVSNQYATVVTELQQYNGAPAQAQTIMHHAEETLRSLDNAVQTIVAGGTFDLSTVLSLVAPLTSMDFQVHSMANALNSKKDTLIKTGNGPLTYNLMRRVWDGAKVLTDNIVEKMPAGVSAIVNVLSREIMYVLTNVRDSFKPAGMPDGQQGGGLPPQQGGAFPPQQGGAFPPQQGGAFPPQQGGGFPPQQGGGFPPQQGGGFPPQQGGFGGQQGGYPPQQGGFGGQQGGYAPQGGFPQQQQQQGGYPQQQGGYPPQQGGVPQQQGGFPQQQGGFPQQQGGFSQQQGGFPQQQGGFGGQQSGNQGSQPEGSYRQGGTQSTNENPQQAW